MASNHYRVVFNNKKDQDCDYRKAEIFNLFHNNKKIGVFNNLKTALYDLYATVNSKEVKYLYNHLGLLHYDKLSHFEIVSIVYTDNHGLIIEQSIRCL